MPRFKTVCAWAFLLSPFLAVEFAAHLCPRLLPNALQIYNARRVLNPHMFEPDDELGYVLKAPLSVGVRWGSFKLSYDVESCPSGGRFGWRRLGAGRIDGSDILALGSSQTFGIDANAEDTWIARLEKETGLTAAALAVHGYSTSQLLSALERCPPGRPPKLVILLLAPSPAVDLLLAAWRRERAAGVLPDWQANNFQYFLFAGNTRSLFIYKAAKTLAGRSLVFNVILSQYLAVESWYVTRDVGLSGMPLMFENILKLRGRFNPRRTKMLVVFTPSWKPIEDRPEVRKFERDLALAGLPPLDLYPVFARENSDRWHTAFDGHWNQYGQQVVANEIELWMRRNGLDGGPGGGGRIRKEGR